MKIIYSLYKNLLVNIKFIFLQVNKNSIVYFDNIFESMKEINISVLERTQSFTDYIAGKMMLRNHFRTGIIEQHNSVRMGSNFCFEGLMLLNLCL